MGRDELYIRNSPLKKGARQWLTALPFVLPGLLLVSAFILYPMLFTLRISLSEYRIVQGQISFIGFEKYKAALMSGSRFWYALRNNVLYALITATSSIAVIAPSAPLLPALVPARSIACSIFSVVTTLKVTGTPVDMLACAIPLAASLQT